MPSQDESQLIDASLQGNSAAFGELVQLHQNRLYNAMVHFCGNMTEAEDVVQEAFVQAYLKLASFQRNSAFYTWLYRIAFNTAISRKRRQRNEASVDQVREQSGIEPLDSGDQPGDQMMRDERAALVHKALGLLSEEHRAILILREMDGCDYEQIAEALSINVGTVRSRLHRARTQLRDRLQELEKEGSG
ncbi:MAG: RNA polymerase subunit sigma-70 [Planctomycetaceae bacterium]|nr:RNA polymerase subunit sigma-70 [Planctomycetaceae bacterium]